MDTIAVNLTELYNTLRRMRRDDMANVIISIVPPDTEDGEDSPACLFITGIRSSEPDIGVDYELIDAVNIQSPNVHMSSNML